jgi:hypothetical protein
MFLWTAERHEAMAQALYRAAQDKTVAARNRFWLWAASPSSIFRRALDDEHRREGRSLLPETIQLKKGCVR